MGRRRKSNQELPRRVYHRHGAYYYCHKDGRWERLGTDLSEAERKAKVFNDPNALYGTMAYWLDRFLLSCEARVGLSAREKGLSKRTAADYKDNIKFLKAYFGTMSPHEVKPRHVGQYLELGRQQQRAIRANREKACLSACFSWLMIHPDAGFAGPNPCTGVKRNPERPADRYVTDEEMEVSLAVMPKMVRGLLLLVYLTLQRPEDVLTWTRRNLIEREGKSVLRVHQSKMQTRTEKSVDIEVTADIQAVLKDLNVNLDGTVTGPGMTFIHGRRGHPYTYDGICSIFRRYLSRAKLKHPSTGEETRVPTWSPYGMKAKGATDMWRAGISLEQIQVLCGHDSITTTEKYVKAHWRDVVKPNTRPVSKKTA